MHFVSNMLQSKTCTTKYFKILNVVTETPSSLVMSSLILFYKNTLILTPVSSPAQPQFGLQPLSSSTWVVGVRGVVQGHNSGVDEGWADVFFPLAWPKSEPFHWQICLQLLAKFFIVAWLVIMAYFTFSSYTLCVQLLDYGLLWIIGLDWC